VPEASTDAVKSPYYQAVRQRSSTLRHVQADLTESCAAAAVYAAFAEFERLAALLPLAPSLSDRMAVAQLITHRHAHYRGLVERVQEVSDPQAGAGMAAVAAPIDEARRRVESTDWWEALTAVALCGPLTDELFGFLVGSAQRAAAEVDGVAAWAMQRVRSAVDQDPVLAARLAMWARRLVGEAIVLTRQFGGNRFPELADRLAEAHSSRLAALGLAG
jgi:hypothetical protein